MEKLQLALEKARRQRETTAETVKPEVRTETKPEQPGFRDTAALWQGLTEIEVDRKRLVGQRIVSLESDESAVHFDLLRTKVLLQMRKNGWKRLAITSPTKACGKTTTAANLALGFARQPDKNVILFEMDLRRPSMSRILGYRPEYGVSDFLGGSVPFSSQAVRISGNVAMSLNATPMRNSAQLLLRDTTARQLDAVESDYQPDMVIFDLPPMLVSDDTTAFLRNADCCLLIAGAETSTVNQVDTCEREIAEHTNVLGVVLNRCRFPEEQNAYSYPGY